MVFLIPLLLGCQVSQSHTTGTKYFEVAVQTVSRGSEQIASISYLLTSVPAVENDAPGFASETLNDVKTEELSQFSDVSR